MVLPGNSKGLGGTELKTCFGPGELRGGDKGLVEALQNF